MSGETAGVDRIDNGEFMCVHIYRSWPFSKFLLTVFHYRKPPEVDGCSCWLTGATSRPSPEVDTVSAPSALPLSLTQQDSIPPGSIWRLWWE